METVTVSPKYQVVIPKSIREAMGIEPGQKLEMVVYDGQVHLIPVPGIEDMRGFAEGLDSRVPREGDRQ